MGNLPLWLAPYFDDGVWSNTYQLPSWCSDKRTARCGPSLVSPDSSDPQRECVIRADADGLSFMELNTADKSGADDTQNVAAFVGARYSPSSVLAVLAPPEPWPRAQRLLFAAQHALSPYPHSPWQRHRPPSALHVQCLLLVLQSNFHDAVKKHDPATVCTNEALFGQVFHSISLYDRLLLVQFLEHAYNNKPWSPSPALLPQLVSLLSYGVVDTDSPLQTMACHAVDSDAARYHTVFGRRWTTCAVVQAFEKTLDEDHKETAEPTRADTWAQPEAEAFIRSQASKWRRTWDLMLMRYLFVLRTALRGRVIHHCAREMHPKTVRAIRTACEGYVVNGAPRNLHDLIAEYRQWLALTSAVPVPLEQRAASADLLLQNAFANVRALKPDNMGYPELKQHDQQLAIELLAEVAEWAIDRDTLSAASAANDVVDLELQAHTEGHTALRWATHAYKKTQAKQNGVSFFWLQNPETVFNE